MKATTVGQMGWFILMGAMYITGAGLYAARIPERYFPGKCDIWVRHYSGLKFLVNWCQTVSHSIFITYPLFLTYSCDGAAASIKPQNQCLLYLRAQLLSVA